MTDYTSSSFGGKIDWESEVQDRSAEATKGAIAGWDENGSPEMKTGSAGQILVWGSDGNPAFATGSGITPPIGSILAWLADYTNTPSLPDGWVECNGQTLNDSESVYDTQTIPDLNGSSGAQRFLRGSTTSGGTGGSDTHTHTLDTRAVGPNGPHGAGTDPAGSDGGDNTSQSSSSLPSYYEVVWIMRVK